MAPRPELDLPLGSAAFWADPYPTWAELRERHPVAWWPVAEAWVVLGHEAAVAVLRDDAAFSPSRRYWSQYQEVPFEQRSLHDQVFDRGLFHLDHDDHIRVRRMVTAAFTPRGVEAQRAFVAQQLDVLLGDLGPGDRFDVATGLAVPLPARVIGHLLGVAEEEHGRFKAVADSMIRGLDPTVFEEIRDEIDAAVAELIELLDRTIAALEGTGADTLLTRLLAVEEAGDRLSRDELVSLVVTLLVAGSDTTVHAISLGALTLLAHPEARAALADDPSRWPAAVDELLRFSYIGGGLVRYARRDTTVAGQPVAAGQMVIVNLAAAHHDPAAFPHPTRLDIDRELGPAVLFGAGSHYCIGAALARLEVQMALQGFFERFPDATGDGDPTWGDHLVLRGLTSLPVRL